MLYLEDYLEMIEHLPQELRDRFTEIREMDLSVQNNMDTLDQRLRNLFNGCRRGEINSEQAQIEFSDINRNFEKTGEEAEEKVAMATQMYDLVNRYIKKLDSELHKFKCELEADNKGITEILEKRSLDLDTNSIINNNNSSSSHYKESRYRVRPERHRVHLWNNGRDSRGHTTTAANVNTSRNAESAIQAALSRDPYALSNSAANGIVLAAATTAVAATQQLSQGRRTASLKATYEALAGVDQHVVHAAHHDHGHGIIAGHGNSIHAHHTTVHGHTSASTSNKRHKQKKSTYATSGLSAQQSLASTASRSNSPTLVDTSAVQNNVTIEEPAEEEWTYDPNEPRYCICNQVSYGDMVACDNQDCPYEWFHYPCVGITAPPKGKWYCPQCQTNIRRNRAHRKN